MRSGLKKGLKVAGGTFAFAFVAIGALHMPFAKSLLAKVGDCPVRATPQQIEAFQKDANQKTRGSTIAPSRPALGFVLDQTTPTDVMAWSDTNKQDCAAQRSDTIILCTNVPSALIGEDGPNVEEVQFDFRLADHKLRIVSTFRGGLTRPEAADVLSKIDNKMAKELGPPPIVAGSPSLDTGTPRGYVVAYNFKDYKADASASQVTHGYGIREHYVAQND